MKSASGGTMDIVIWGFSSLSLAQNSYGTTKSIEVAPEFFLGGVRRDVLEDPGAQKNLMVSCQNCFSLRECIVKSGTRHPRLFLYLNLRPRTIFLWAYF